MTIEAFYAAVGGDYQATLRRLMVPEIVETFAVRYAQDTTVDRLHRALAPSAPPTPCGDWPRTSALSGCIRQPPF